MRSPPSQSGYVFVVSPTWPLLIPHVLLPLLLHGQWSGDAFRANVDALGAMAAAAAAAGGIVPIDWETRVNAYFQQVSALLSSFMAPRMATPLNSHPRPSLSTTLTTGDASGSGLLGHGDARRGTSISPSRARRTGTSLAALLRVHVTLM